MTPSKKELRQQLTLRLKALSALDRLEQSTRIQHRVMQTAEFQSASVIMAYHADSTEVDTHDIISASLATGKRIVLPRMRQGSRELDVIAIRDMDQDLEECAYGFKEPRPTLPHVDPTEIDLIVVPGRAYDKDGLRLGRGAGFYDRFLSKSEVRAIAMGMVFDFQIVDAIPSEPHDREVDIVVTESRIFRRGG